VEGCSYLPCPARSLAESRIRHRPSVGEFSSVIHITSTDGRSI